MPDRAVDLKNHPELDVDEVPPHPRSRDLKLHGGQPVGPQDSVERSVFKQALHAGVDISEGEFEGASVRMCPGVPERRGQLWDAAHADPDGVGGQGHGITGSHSRLGGEIEHRLRRDRYSAVP